MRAAVPQLAAALPPQPIAAVSARLRKYVILLTSRSWHRRCSVERVLKASLQIARRADFTQTFQERCDMTSKTRRLREVGLAKMRFYDLPAGAAKALW
jgi:hypothetical protein